MQYIWHEDTNFHRLDPTTQVYGICFDEGENVLIMKEAGKEWNIPGGKPQGDETPAQTLKRELLEEVDVIVDKYQMIGYFEGISDKPTFYQLRFACTIETIKEQTIDPDPIKHAIHERKFVKPSEFFDFVKIEDYRPMLDKAIQWYEKNKNII